MTVRSITALLLASLLCGCSTLGLPSADNAATTANPDDDTPVNDSVMVAAGDDDLIDAVDEQDSGVATDDSDGSTELDDAIAESLKTKAEDARERLNAGKNDDEPSGTAKQNDDLWARLRDMFELDHSVDNPRVQQQLAWYSSHPKYIQRVVDRGSRYLYYIVDQLDRRNMPGELALLPIVESAFDPFAYSHGRAAGMWQFIPSTGKYFGLKQSWWHDQRRDIVASTDAALDYLERLSERFDGDYTLALASYNSGAGTVLNAIRDNSRHGKPTDFWSLQLPQETRVYVPKLIALAKIFADPAAYGISLEPIEDKPYFAVVDTGSQIDLAQAADLADVDIDEIYLLNPSYNRWATSPDGPHRLLVPSDHADTFRKGLAHIDPRKRVAWRNYRVVSGDNLNKIAKQFNTTTGVIQQVNNIHGSFIKVGQRLLIPTAREGSKEYVLSASQRLARKQARSGSHASGTRITHTVRSGDTFWDIARENGVSVRQLASWNGMAPGDPLLPGKKLVLWSKAPRYAVASTQRDRTMVRKVGYHVRKGDSLAAIASRFSVNVSDIASWNDLNTARYLQPGQSLVLYVDIRTSP